MFEWTIAMRIDNGKIDKDHQKLISLANTVLELDRPNRDAEELKRVIRELYDYVRYHFTREEQLMEQLKYPGLPGHHEKHELIIQEMNHYLTSSHHMSEMLSNFRALVNKWVIKHIMEEDMNLHHFMEARVQSFLSKN